MAELAKDSAERQYSDFTIFKRLLRQARPYWLHIAGVLGLSLLATPLALLQPVPLKIAVDSVIGEDALPGFLVPVVPDWLMSSDIRLLILAALLVVGIALLNQLQGIGHSLLRTYTGEKLVLRFRSRLLRHAQRLSLCYHDRAGTTDSLYRIQYDAPSIQWITIDGVIPFASAAFTLVGMIYVTARLDLQLALVALLVSPLLIALTRLFRKRLRAQWRHVKELENSALSVLQETLSALRVVKAFGQEGREQRRFVARHSEGVGARLRVMAAEGGFSLLVGLTTAAGTAAVLYLGVRHVQTGVITLGELLIIMSYIGQIYTPLKTMGTKVTTLQKQFASAERAFTLLDRTPEVVERPGARPIRRAEGHVAFEGVSFGYAEETSVLRDIAFRVEAGSKVGIAGRTGAGKSTLISLLTRFYDPDEGRITLDGTDLRDYRLGDLRDQFAIVLQETVLFSTNIAENIAYARPGASFREIVEAARAANAHEFILGLSDGYDTVVGERGMLLSGGERQRIALARAFLKDAPVLVLDEPTSSVDVATEAAIMDAMERLMWGRTTFMIAHRLSTLEECDLMLVLEGGRIIVHTTEVAPLLDGMRRTVDVGGAEALATRLATRTAGRPDRTRDLEKGAV